MITVHHLNNSRSQRVLWLLEELGLDYTVVRYQRDPKTNLAPPELKAITSRPCAFRSRAFASAARVADGLTRASAADSSDMAGRLPKAG